MLRKVKITKSDPKEDKIPTFELMVQFPNAKINLGLRVLGKRKDGFHEIESILYPIGLSDAVECIRSENEVFEFGSTGLEIPGDREGNLCIKAYELMKERYGIPTIQMHLHKCIPMGAGLGGGSSDAAFVLKMINKMFSLSLEFASLEKISAELGSDCPFFIQNRPAIARGRGEILDPVDLSLAGMHLVLVKPQVHIDTGKAYSNIQIKETGIPLEKVVKRPAEEWRESLNNDFEDYAFREFTQLSEIKTQLYNAGAIYASMTGSGSAIYGLFSDRIPELDIDGSYFKWKGILS